MTPPEPPPTGPESDRQLAWGWVEHLRSGGSTSWQSWQSSAGRPGAVPAGRKDPGTPLPGAAQLELVRLLAVHASREGAVPAGFTALADRALARSGPGRGLPELPLRLPSGDRPGAGPVPVDPADVPTGELVRIGVGLLADLLCESAGDAAAPDPAAPRRRLWSRSFRLVGAPITTAVVRADLAADGHVEGGRSPRVVVLAEPLDSVLAQVWSDRVQQGVPMRWPAFVTRWAKRDRLPPAADLAQLADGWADLVGAGRVHVVAAPDLAAAVRATLRLRPARRTAVPGGGRGPAGPLPLSLAAVDLVRRLNPVLNVRLDEEPREEVLRRLMERLPRGGRPLAVPPRHRRWLDGRAERIVEQLTSKGYPVHGDPELLAPRHAGTARPRHQEVLDVLLGVVTQVAESDAGWEATGR
jgi:hypothetical protein